MHVPHLALALLHRSAGPLRYLEFLMTFLTDIPIASVFSHSKHRLDSYGPRSTAILLTVLEPGAAEMFLTLFPGLTNPFQLTVLALCPHRQLLSVFFPFISPCDSNSLTRHELHAVGQSTQASPQHVNCAAQFNCGVL